MSRRAARAILFTALISWTAPVFAQSLPAPPRTPREALVSTYEAAFLRDLPTGDNLFATIDALQPSIVADRFTAGGLSVAQPARLGGFLSSWTQTLFRVDGVSMTDPTGRGAPLLVPDLALWSSVRVGTGAFNTGTNAAGLVIDLRTPPPADRWVGTVEGALSHGFLTASGAGAAAPPLAGLGGLDRATLSASGPLARRVGASVAVSGTRGSQTDRGSAASASSGLSTLAHLVFTPSSLDAIRVLGWMQRRRRPLEVRTILQQPTATATTTTGRAQLVWDHRLDDTTALRLATSVTSSAESPDYANASSGIADRLVDGPIAQFASLADRVVRAWSVDASVAPRRTLAGREHAFEAGVEVEGGHLTASRFFSGTIGELVHESPARVWRFISAGVSSIRRGRTMGAYLSDRVTVADRLSLEAGLRAESVSGSADGAASGITWRSMLPRASVRWTLDDRFGLSASGSYSRSAHRLALDDLAIGDPAAPTADVFRWNAPAGLPLSLADRGSLVARAGPGTGGTPGFASIDPQLRRPLSDELVLSLEATPRQGVLLRLAGVARKERDLAGLTNPGAPVATSYTSFTVQDPGSNLLGAEDDQLLTVYNRIPSSFGQDAYVLTTPGHAGSTFKGLELTIQLQTDRFTLTAGGTAGIAETFAAGAGFGPTENDQTVIGDLLTNPNATTLAHGRPFTDRAYTAKLAGVFLFPHAVRLGLIARYQDGQPFSRVLVFPGLTQGADAVRAFSNGESRFKFVGTLDVRLQKTFTIGGRVVDGFVDVYNVPNLSNSVEENVAAGPDIRIPTATQPPRSVHVGVRLPF